MTVTDAHVGPRQPGNEAGLRNSVGCELVTGCDPGPGDAGCPRPWAPVAQDRAVVSSGSLQGIMAADRYWPPFLPELQRSCVTVWIPGSAPWFSSWVWAGGSVEVLGSRGRRPGTFRTQYDLVSRLCSFLMSHEWLPGEVLLLARLSEGSGAHLLHE